MFDRHNLVLNQSLHIVPRASDLYFRPINRKVNRPLHLVEGSEGSDPLYIVNTSSYVISVALLFAKQWEDGYRPSERSVGIVDAFLTPSKKAE